MPIDFKALLRKHRERVSTSQHDPFEKRSVFGEDFFRARDHRVWRAQDAWAAAGHQGEMTGKWQTLFECTLLSPEQLVLAKKEKIRLLRFSRIEHRDGLEADTAELTQLSESLCSSGDCGYCS